LYDQFAALRRAGWGYREIGLKFGLSHERVRQVLTRDGELWKRPTAKEKRAVRIRELAAWLDENGPITRDAFMAEFGLTGPQLTQLVTEGLPSHMILLPTRSTDVFFSDEDVHEALRRAWGVLQERNPGSLGMSHVMYERVRKLSDPSAAALVARFGWETACADAGVPSGYAYRAKDTYESRWTDEDLLGIVREYVDECVGAKQRPTYLGYERWQQLSDERPSGTLIRTRMRQLALMTWAEIVSAAMNRG
jgi:hypothetical protein